jgi:cyclophilin family peptidyl-prolyl cis-trans isomerase
VIINFEPVISRLNFIAILLVLCSCGRESRPIISPDKPLVFDEPKNSPEADSAHVQEDELDSLVSNDSWDRIYQYNVEERLSEYGENNKETRFKISTSFGEIKVKLYNSTPLHRASMVLLIKKGLFNGSRFYRVREDFIIQGGFTDGPGAFEKLIEIGRYKVPPEIDMNSHPHVRGAFALAGADFIPGVSRDKKSNPFTFYIVQGSVHSDASLTSIEKAYGLDLSDENKNRYKKQGGTPHLDNQYTVCGEVYSGMNVVEKINKVKTNRSEQPNESIYLSVSLIE